MTIASLKRYAADHFDRPEDWDLSVAEDNGKRVAMIGAGPSGLRAVLDLRQAGCEVTVYKKKCRCGAGCCVWVSRSTACRANEIGYLDRLGIRFVLDCKIGKDKGEQERLDDNGLENMDCMIAYSCNECSQCTLKCPSCFKVFKETAANQRVIAYWDLMRNLIGLSKRSKGVGLGSDVVFNIHDSCVTRDKISHHESIRWILDELGYRWDESSAMVRTPGAVV